ncbi:DNA (cytosine-5-)-methyltransferase, partial [Bacteroides fragilis]
FPQDYHFLNQSPHYICGMSVPPVMMAHVASRIWKYWLSKL